MKVSLVKSAENSSKLSAQLVNSKSQGVIFTDSPTLGLGFISSELNRRLTAKQMASIQFMGITRWDATKQTLSEPSLQGGWFVITDSRFKEKYLTRFSETFGYMPHKLSSLSYDAIAAIGALAKNSFKTDETNIFSSENISNSTGFLGVGGAFRFNKDGSNERATSVVTSKNGQLIILDQAPKNFNQVNKSNE